MVESRAAARNKGQGGPKSMPNIYPHNGSATVIHGRGVRHYPLDRRLDLAAACTLGWKPLQTSFEQAVPAFIVPRAGLKERIELFRALEENGNDSSAVIATPVVTENKKFVASIAEVEALPISALVHRMRVASPEDLLAVAEVLGPAKVWDHMIAPLVGNGR
jgi:hypothetical protein